MIYKKTDFEHIGAEQLERWILLNGLNLVGSAVFTQNTGFVSKLVRFATKKQCENEFKPSHIGSLVLVGGHVYIFDMKPPKARLTSFEDYIRGTKDDFIIIPRDFELDLEEFSLFLINKTNKRYDWDEVISAVQSAFKRFHINIGEHCSEMHLEALQKQGLFMQHNPNTVSPARLLDILSRVKNR